MYFNYLMFHFNLIMYKMKLRYNLLEIYLSLFFTFETHFFSVPWLMDARAHKERAGIVTPAPHFAMARRLFLMMVSLLFLRLDAR